MDAASPVSVFRRRAEAWIALAVVAADQAAKWVVLESLPLHGSVTVVPGLLSITHVRNTGAAFGLLNAVDFPYKTAAIIAMALCALVAIAVYGGRFASETWIGRVALALVLGGAVGNLIDRARQGYVVDFVDVYWGGWHFWAFNLADAAISVGAAALVLDMLGAGRRVSSAA